MHLEMSRPWNMITAVIVCAILFRIFEKASASHHAADTTPANPRINTVSAVAWSWLAPACVMAVFVGLSGKIFHHLENQFLPTPLKTIFPQPEVLPDVDQTACDAGIVEPTEIARPEWTNQGDQTSDDVRHVVLSSKLWSTLAEADQELRPKVAEIVRKDFEEHQHSVFDRGSQTSLTDESLFHHAVKKQYLETVDQDFGTFSAPMFRRWMQVEISPMVRTALYPEWKKANVGNRVIVVGFVLATLTFIANSASLFARLKTVPNRRLSFTTAIVASSAVGWALVDLYLVKFLFA
jgi:hypothetical protein